MKRALTVILFIFIVYAFWNGRNLLLGPQIKIASPRNGFGTEGNLIVIVGTAKNVSFLSMNGRQIFVDEQNNFNEDVVLLSGLNIIELRGKDRFGKETVKTLQIYKK